MQMDASQQPPHSQGRSTADTPAAIAQKRRRLLCGPSVLPI